MYMSTDAVRIQCPYCGETIEIVIDGSLEQQNYIEDWERAFGGKKPVGAEQFQVGVNLAVTPGRVGK